VRYAHVRFELPPLGLMVPPRGPPRSFCCGAAARAGERLQNKAGEVSPDPSYSAREACRRRHPPQASLPMSGRSSVCPPSLKAAGVQEPRCPPGVHRTCGPRKLVRTGVAGRSAALRQPPGSAVVFFLPDTFLRRPSTPRERSAPGRDPSVCMFSAARPNGICIDRQRPGNTPDHVREVHRHNLVRV